MRRILRQDRSTVALVCGFALVVACFLAATLLTHRAAGQIDAASNAIAHDTAPSIEHLAAVRVDARQVTMLLDRALRSGSWQPAGQDRADLDSSLSAIDAEVAAYLQLPLAEGERSLWEQIRTRSVEFEVAARRVLALADRGALVEAREAMRAELRPSSARLLDAANRDVELNARSGHDQAMRIEAARGRSLRLGIALDVLCATLAALAAIVVWRQVRRQVEVLEAQAQVQSDRAKELESFAGRVAHDIMNPVTAAKMALTLASREEVTPPKKREAFLCAQRSLARVETILTGLLRFAHAGARPEPGAIADVATVIEDVLSGVTADAERVEAEICKDVSPCVAACDRGVLTSLLSNLIGNALKYLGESPRRRILVRAHAKGSAVRVEVEDTGPGLAPDLIGRVFQPYVRGGGRTQPGIGLGLATVKRLVDGHHGRLGVKSEPGRGCLFWFELPAAVPRP